MKNKLDTKTNQNIVRWLRGQTLFLIFSSIVSFLLVELAGNDFQFSWSVFLKSLGIIIPMVFFLTIINYIFAKKFANEVNFLSKALEKASLGDYNAKLDPSLSSILEDAYINFNKLEESLKRANALQDNFVNSYSHEFKTPINSIKGFAELMLDEKLSLEDQKRYLNIIIEESKRLTALAESSILMSKLDSQTIVVHKEKYFLDEQLRRCVILFEPEWTKKEIKITCNLKETEFYGSEEVMEHLWINLISNAIKYTKNGGHISINLKSDDHNIIVSITDDGIGISKDDLKKIFDKFYQVDKSKNAKGLGLGLTIVNRILQIIEGKIKVESESGKGSVFTVLLPKN